MKWKKQSFIRIYLFDPYLPGALPIIKISFSKHTAKKAKGCESYKMKRRDQENQSKQLQKPQNKVQLRNNALGNGALPGR